MPSLSELPSDLNREKFTKSLNKLGFEIDKRGGNGSHYKIVCPNQKIVIVQHKLHKHMLMTVLKEIERYSGVTWDQIKKKL